MGRYQTASFTTASVAGSGGVLNHDLTIPANGIDISRIKITPSVSTGTQTVEIFLTASRGSGDLLYSTRAWTATYFSDPADNVGAEGLQGWVVPYYDGDETTKLHLRFTNNHTSAKTYAVEIDYEYMSTSDAGVEGVPEELFATAIANGLVITSGVVTGKNGATNVEAEFRAKRLATGEVDNPQDLRLVAEGGAFVPDGVSSLQVTSIVATRNGAQYVWTSASAGRWYYVWRVKNATGWSRWTDGNITPQNVVQFVDTQDASLADVGPPADWEVWCEPGPSTGTIVVHASRPRTNGRNLLWWNIQVKDGSTGSWLSLDDGAAPTDVKYDGSLVAHTLSADRCTLSKAASGWGTAAVGDLLLLDVRGGNFDVSYCQWASIESIGTTSVTISGFYRPQSFSDLRCKIVAKPTSWVGSGYLGDQDNAGMWPSGDEASLNMGLGLGWIFGDYDTEEFVSTPINIPVAVTNPEARVWFENVYCRSDGDIIHSTGLSAGVGIFTTPRTFTDFNDRDFWLPVYPHPNWGTLVFNSSGYVTAACASGNLVGENGQSGVRSRFRVYPDSSGYLQIQTRFENVTIPVGTAVGDGFAICIAAINDFNYQYPTSGVWLLNKDNISANMDLNEAMIQPKGAYTASYSFPYGCIGHFRAPTYTRPTSGSIVELRFTATERDWLGFRRVFAIESVEARTGGSGGYTSARPTYGDFGSGSGIKGFYLFIGLVGNMRLSGATARLTQVNILNGIAEYC
jgi:hypothetical protein